MGRTASRTNGKRSRTPRGRPVARTAKSNVGVKKKATKRVGNVAKLTVVTKAGLRVLPSPKQRAAAPSKAKSSRRSKAAERPKTTPPPKPRKKAPTPEERARAAYDGEVLAVLRDEFPNDDQALTNEKIRARLREKSLGAFDAARVDTLRRLKDDLQSELSSGPRSGHFTGAHGLYANPEDFDHAELVNDYTAKYPRVSSEAIAAFIPLAVYLYYLR